MSLLYLFFFNFLYQFLYFYVTLNYLYLLDKMTNISNYENIKLQMNLFVI